MNTGPLASVVVRLEVTQEDIDQGVEGSCENCPVALALRRATGAFTSVDSASMVLWRSCQPTCTMDTPKEIVEFIRRFDNGGVDMVEPFTMGLTLPAWIVGEAEAA